MNFSFSLIIASAYCRQLRVNFILNSAPFKCQRCSKSVTRPTGRQRIAGVTFGRTFVGNFKSIEGSRTRVSLLYQKSKTLFQFGRAADVSKHTPLNMKAIHKLGKAPPKKDITTFFCYRGSIDGLFTLRAIKTELQHLFHSFCCTLCNCVSFAPIDLYVISCICINYLIFIISVKFRLAIFPRDIFSFNNNNM